MGCKMRYQLKMQELDRGMPMYAYPLHLPFLVITAPTLPQVMGSNGSTRGVRGLRWQMHEAECKENRSIFFSYTKS